ncbi:MmcQ-like protein [Tenacibaculum litopenaei]|uniref:MmcQ/YjbR family DNA-binding protein n=1 Tax=Tenacibaculum litopenaei TaxID=396016 RepID=UPI0038950A1A
MNVEQLRNYCIQKKGVTEHFPFDEVTLVFKVMGKMFALTGLDKWEAGIPSVNLKCNPEWSLELRGTYDGINPGFHMNKKHWNTVTINEDVDDAMLRELIDHSYETVVKGLPKKTQASLNEL